MTTAQTSRLATITAHFTGLGNDEYQLEGASRFLRAMAKSTVPTADILAEMTATGDQGYAVPATRLGIVKAPKRGGCYMADVRSVSFRLTRSDITEMYGPLARQ